VTTTRRLLAAGLAAFIVFLIIQAPARIGLAMLADTGLRGAGISGTVWNGRVQAATLGQLPITDLRWQLSPLRLLVGRAAVDVDGQLADGFINGRIEFGFGQLQLRGFRLSSTLDALGLGLGLPLGGGPFSCEIERAVVRAGWFTALVAELRLAEMPLPIPMGPDAAPGGFTISFAADRISAGEPLEGLVQNLGGPLEVQARVMLTPPTSYELTGLARPLPGAPPELAQGLAMLGPRNPDGSYEFTLAGSF